MAWKITFSQDTEVETIGTATAEYVDNLGNSAASISARLDISNDKEIEAFRAKAEALLASKQSELSKAQVIITNLEARMNDAKS